MVKLSDAIRVPAHEPIDVSVGVQDSILMRQQHLGLRVVDIVHFNERHAEALCDAIMSKAAAITPRGAYVSEKVPGQPGRAL